MISIINYGLVNIRAFENIFNLLNLPFSVASSKIDLEKAEKIGGKQNDILTNKGVIAARRGQLTTAQKFFNDSKTTELNQAILNIRKGEYQKAVRFFKNNSSYNATLAMLLNGNNNAKCDENTAACYYLNAISYVRSKDYSNAIKHIERAINTDSKYKKEALEDLEFIDLRENEDFINLVN